jgi:PAS domain-containing protein
VPDQRHVELILLRQLGGHLSIAAFFVDPRGNLVFYNEAAESILGMRYEETGEMAESEWTTRFVPTDSAGNLLPPEGLPLITAVEQRVPAHGAFWITGADGVRRHISVTALPFVGLGGRDLGSLALFWESAADAGGTEP